MKRRRALAALAALLLASGAAHAAFELEWPDARQAVSVGAVEPWALRALAAADPVVSEEDPARAREWSFVLSGGELYALKEARGSAAEASLSTGTTRVVFRLSTLGSPLYRERVLGVALSRRVADAVVCGARVRALGIDADGCDGAAAFALDAGVTARAAGRLLLGGRFENLGATRIGGSAVAAPAVVGALLALEGLTFEVGVRMEEGFDAAVVCSAEAALGLLALRARADSETGTFAIGVGAAHAPPGARPGPVASRRGGRSVDAACWWHPRLGASVCVSVGFGM